MNIDNLDIRIKHQSTESFSRIRGPHFESIFSHGARIGEQRINMPLNVENALVGVWETTHMQPYVYAGETAPNGHHPRDDFYFADFVTRIHRDDPMDGSTTPTMIADCPDDARYPDGEYEVYALNQLIVKYQSIKFYFTYFYKSVESLRQKRRIG